jgi:hypothetical protein
VPARPRTGDGEGRVRWVAGELRPGRWRGHWKCPLGRSSRLQSTGNGVGLRAGGGAIGGIIGCISFECERPFYSHDSDGKGRFKGAGGMNFGGVVTRDAESSTISVGRRRGVIAEADPKWSAFCRDLCQSKTARLGRAVGCLNR